MRTPDLIPVRPDELSAAVLREAAEAGVGPVRCYAVVRAGVFDGRSFHAGDVVVCGGRPQVDERVVLVPTGRGRPVFGHRRRDGLRGDRGEPCDASRWMPVGAVVRVVERAHAVVDPVGPVAAEVVVYRQRRAPAPQLALFPQPVAA
ncbi:MAG: hypothetical protein H6733_04690 [Alphaproteobacteria bacterium]|nr:hypothetical protein [Alphaproteobacteria bacterium]